MQKSPVCTLSVILFDFDLNKQQKVDIIKILNKYLGVF